MFSLFLFLFCYLHTSSTSRSEPKNIRNKLADHLRICGFNKTEEDIEKELGSWKWRVKLRKDGCVNSRDDDLRNLRKRAVKMQSKSLDPSRFCRHLNECSKKGYCVRVADDAPEECRCVEDYTGEDCSIITPKTTEATVHISQVTNRRQPTRLFYHPNTMSPPVTQIPSTTVDYNMKPWLITATPKRIPSRNRRVRPTPPLPRFSTTTNPSIDVYISKIKENTEKTRPETIVHFSGDGKKQVEAISQFMDGIGYGQADYELSDTGSTIITPTYDPAYEHPIEEGVLAIEEAGGNNSLITSTIGGVAAAISLATLIAAGRWIYNKFNAKDNKVNEEETSVENGANLIDYSEPQEADIGGDNEDRLLDPLNPFRYW